MSDPELDLLREPIGADQDGSRPASHPKLLRYPLLRILDQGERQPQALANFPERSAVVAAVERDDERRASPGLVQSLQAAELRETRRRPGLPEIQQDLSAAEAMKRKLVSGVGLELSIRGWIAMRNGQPQRTKSRRRGRDLVPIDRSCQLRRIGLARVLPGELTPGVE